MNSLKAEDQTNHLEKSKRYSKISPKEAWLIISS